MAASAKTAVCGADVRNTHATAAFHHTHKTERSHSLPPLTTNIIQRLYWKTWTIFVAASPEDTSYIKSFGESKEETASDSLSNAGSTQPESSLSDAQNDAAGYQAHSYSFATLSSHTLCSLCFICASLQSFSATHPSHRTQHISLSTVCFSSSLSFFFPTALFVSTGIRWFLYYSIHSFLYFMNINVSSVFHHLVDEHLCRYSHHYDCVCLYFELLSVTHFSFNPFNLPLPQ